MAKAKAPGKAAAKPAGTKSPTAKPKKARKPRVDNTEYVDYVWEESPTPTYANIVMLSDFDDIFSFAFAEVRPEARAVRGRDRKLHVDGHVVASIRMPPSAMPTVINEFVRAWNRYVDSLPEEKRDEYNRYYPAFPSQMERV